MSKASKEMVLKKTELRKDANTSISEMLENPVIKKRLQDLLEGKTDSFISTVIQLVSNSDVLQKCDKNSILFASVTAATMDLSINPNLGFAYIIPFWDSKANGFKAQFQLGYKGFIQLAMRSGQFKTINVCKVYESDTDDEILARLTSMRPTQKQEELSGYTAYFKLLNGFEKSYFMSIDELKEHGLQFSQTMKKGYGLWVDNFDSMAEKTVLKLLLAKYAPLSTEMQKAVITDQSVVNDFDAENLEYVDNKEEVKTLEEVNKEEETKRIAEFIKTVKTKKQLEKVSVRVKLDKDLQKQYDDKLKELSNV